MTREEAKELLPVLKAWTEDRIIQFRKKGTSEWIDLLEGDIRVSEIYAYRIKPEPKYRSFKNQEECWEEMHNHSNFGWIRYEDSISAIQNIAPDGITVTDGIKTSNFYFEECLANTKFADGTPFGIKEGC